MDYIERIRALRVDGNFNQEQIADLLHVHQTTYSEYELGKSNIPVSQLVKLAKYYNVNMDYICGVSNKKTEFPKE